MTRSLVLGISGGPIGTRLWNAWKPLWIFFFRIQTWNIIHSDELSAHFMTVLTNPCALLAVAVYKGCMSNDIAECSVYCCACNRLSLQLMTSLSTHYIVVLLAFGEGGGGVWLCSETRDIPAAASSHKKKEKKWCPFKSQSPCVLQEGTCLFQQLSP